MVSITAHTTVRHKHKQHSKPLLPSLRQRRFFNYYGKGKQKPKCQEQINTTVIIDKTPTIHFKNNIRACRISKRF